MDKVTITFEIPRELSLTQFLHAYDPRVQQLCEILGEIYLGVLSEIKKEDFNEN